jgi:hypothetical protein
MAYSPIPTPVSPPPPRRRRALWATAAIVVTAGLAVGIAALTGAFASRPTPKAPGPTFILHGSLSLIDAGITLNLSLGSDNSCEGINGFSDLSVGTAVTVADPQGRQVATGALTTGILDEPSSGGPSSCVFGFSVAAVPAGLSSYSVTISHRGTQVYSEEQARTGLALSISGS